MDFKSLGIQEQLLKALNDLGFTQPTPIQEKSIPILLEGSRDYVGLAQTGTGKTAAFGLPLIQSINSSTKATQGLVLCPTRELCLQITKELKSFATYIDGLKVVAIYGGASINEQIRSLRQGAHIVVGTPGRVLDHISRNTINLSNVQVVVLDEADEMLNMGFQEDINTILSETPEEKRVWLFSATMPKSVERIAQKYMTDPVRIAIGHVNESAKNIAHQYCVVKSADSYEALKRFVAYYPDMFGIVFCRTRRETQEISEKLSKDGYNADALHGDLSQAQRDAVMRKFRHRKLQLLVATDVAARGIDVSDVTHVIHYNLPEDVESYTHRSGRTARAGKSGISIAIIHQRDLRRIGYIEKQIKQPMQLISVPTGVQICERQVAYFVQHLQATEVNKQAIQPYIDTILESLRDLTKEELVMKIVSYILAQTLKAYEHAPDISVSADHKARKFEDYSEDKEGQVRLFINLGSMDDMDKSGFLKFLTSHTTVPNKSINRIVMQEKFTFFTVDTMDQAEAVIEGLADVVHNRRKVRIERAGERSAEPRRSSRRDDRSGYRSNRSGSRGRGHSFSRDNDRRGGGRSSSGRRR